jgi:hypothetical protein
MKNLLLPILLAMTTLSFAQEIPLNIVNRINEVNFIFEGKVINSEPYYTNNGGYIHTSNTVEITKILKGEIECGTIEIITKGGTIANRTIEVSHALELIEGSSGIFLCTETDRPNSIIDFYPETNLEVLEATFENQSFIRYWWNGHEINATDIWQNYDSLAQVYNVAEVITGLQFIDCKGQLFDKTHGYNTPQNDEVFPTYKQEDFDSLLNYAAFKRNNYTRIKSTESIDKIFYNLNNLVITGSTQKYLEFDITVKDNIGSKYLDQSAIRLEYDPLAFGTNIVANSNIIVTRGTLNADTNCYSPPIPSDVNPNTILIPALETVFSQCKAPILLTDQSIMHVKMKIQTCDIPNNIALVDTATFFGPSLIINYSAYADFPADTFQTSYEELAHNQIEIVPACKITITDFYPKEVAGGINDTLTIRGFQFGINRGNGNIYFKNANDAGLSEVFLDSLDYILWSDTLIKIRVPSYDSVVIFGTAYKNQPAGTGFFRISNNIGDTVTSSVPLKIKFSVANDSRKKAYVISPRTIFNKKITFHCSNEVANYAGGAMKSVIEKALKDWTCLTGIDWEMGNDTLYTDSMATEDNLCIITFENLNSNALAQAIGYKAVCNFVPDSSSVYYEMDIAIDTNNLFSMDTISSSIPPGHLDFYSIILHELGHAHNLKHVIGINEIMHYGISPQQIRRDLEFNYSCDEGGNWVIDFSTDTINNLVNNCSMENINANPITPCSHLSIEEIGEKTETFKIFPNPFTETLNISFNSLLSEKIDVNLFDLTGKLIFNKKYSVNNGENSIIINTNYLLDGAYIITIHDKVNSQSFKLIKNGH